MAKKAQSKKVGRGTKGGGWYGNTSVQVFEALAPIPCETCSETIEPGQRFTRQMMKGGGNRTFPFCRRCRPFTGPDNSAALSPDAPAAGTGETDTMKARGKTRGECVREWYLACRDHARQCADEKCEWAAAFQMFLNEPHKLFDYCVQHQGWCSDENCELWFAFNRRYKREVRKLPPKPTTTPTLLPTAVEHRVKLPVAAVTPDPPAARVHQPVATPTYGVLGNPSLDTIIAHLGDALECELSAEEDAWELTLRRHITDAVVETERLLAAQKLPLIWAAMMDMLAGKEGWARWQKKVAAWTGDPVSAFLETWWMDHPEIEEVDPDTVDIPTLPADWTIPAEWHASPMAVLLANASPDSVQPPKLAVVEPEAREVPPTSVDAPAPPAKPLGQWYPASSLREVCRALKAFERQFEQKPTLIKLPAVKTPHDLVARQNVLGVPVTFDPAVHAGKAWIGKAAA